MHICPGTCGVQRTTLDTIVKDVTHNWLGVFPAWEVEAGDSLNLRATSSTKSVLE